MLHLRLSVGELSIWPTPLGCGEVDVQPLGRDLLISGYPDYVETRN